ncbi:MAG: AMP-binding protein, partial [Pseudomonadota bacterium]
MYPGHWAAIKPDEPAVIHAETGDRLSWRELDERSNQLAQLLWARGLRPQDHIALFMENNLRFFEICWAALRSGIYITTVNRYLTADEAGYIVDNCEAKALITSAKLADVARDLAQYAPNCTNWLMVDDTIDGYESYEAAIATQPTTRLDDEPAGQFMLYSSGTTGRPKGIFRPPSDKKISDEDNGIGGLQKMIWGFGEDTVYLSPAPLYHSAPIGFSIAAQALGGAVVMMSRFDEVGAIRAIQDYQVTH